MLEEKIRYDHLPVEIRILEICNYPLHFHYGMEIAYVMQGNVTLQCGSSKYCLNEDNVFVINKGEVHGFYHASPDCIIAFIHIKTNAFIDCFPNILTSCIRTNSYEGKDEKYADLLVGILSILDIYISRDLGYEEKLLKSVSELLVFLDENYNHFIFDQKTVVFKGGENKVQENRMRSIIRYCYRHHNEKVTLETISKEENLNAYYLSHLIRGTLGISFRELLAFARIEISERILLGTEKSVDKIAMEVGFSSARYYIAHFTNWYGMTPQEYRDKYAQYTRRSYPGKMKRANSVLLLDKIKKKQDALMGFSEDHNFTWKETVYVVGSKEDLSCGERLDCSSLLYLYAENQWKPFGDMVEGHAKKRENRFVKDVPFHGGAGCYAWDTVISIPYLIKKCVCDKSILQINSIKDKDVGKGVISGQRGVFTYNGIPKPAYFAYQCLHLLEGEILHAENRHIIIKKSIPDRAAQYMIMIWNVHKELEYLLEENVSLEEFASMINSFGNYEEVSVELKGLSGMYNVTQYTLNHSSSLFQYLLENDIRSSFSDYRTQEIAKLHSVAGVTRRYEALTGTFFHKVDGTDLSAQLVVLNKAT